MSEGTRQEPATEPVYNPADPQSGRALVNHHLRELGLGESWLVKVADDGQRSCQPVMPRDIGVCRAYVLTEAAWPEGAELCVTVEWSPDAALSRNDRTGQVPIGAEEHWRERIAATAQALEGLGYVVEPSRFRCSPRYYPTAELLVYQMPAGVPPRRVPADTAWALSKPVPLHYQQRYWAYPERSPEEIVCAALDKAGLRPDRQDEQSPFGRIGVRSITQTVWPPEADRCAWVTWWPADVFARDREAGLLPPGIEEHWHECLDRLRRALTAAGLALRSRSRPFDPAVEESADFLVYRVACSSSNSNPE